MMETLGTRPFAGTGVRGVAAALHQFDRARRAQGMLMEAAGLGPREQPSRIVHRVPGVALRRYSDACAPAVLLVPAPIKRPYIWDLVPQRSVVRRYLEAGYRVYLADWTPPGAEDRLGLEDYVERVLGACVDFVRQDSGQERVWLAGHSLGGTLAGLYSTLRPEAVAGLVLIEAPLHFASDAFAPLVRACSKESLRELSSVPGSLLTLAAFMASPQEFQWARQMDLLHSVGNQERLSMHLRVKRWCLDEFPLPGPFFAELLEWLYREDRFMRGALVLAGEILSPARLTVPLLNVAERGARVIPPAAVSALDQAAGSRTKRLIWYGGDQGVGISHVGALVGERAHGELWPEILRWMRTVAADDANTM